MHSAQARSQRDESLHLPPSQRPVDLTARFQPSAAEKLQDLSNVVAAKYQIPVVLAEQKHVHLPERSDLRRA